MWWLFPSCLPSVVLAQSGMFPLPYDAMYFYCSSYFFGRVRNTFQNVRRVLHFITCQTSKILLLVLNPLFEKASCFICSRIKMAVTRHRMTCHVLLYESSSLSSWLFTDCCKNLDITSCAIILYSWYSRNRFQNSYLAKIFIEILIFIFVRGAVRALCHITVIWGALKWQNWCWQSSYTKNEGFDELYIYLYVVWYTFVHYFDINELWWNN